jgi:hypothetical protein
VWPQYRWQGRTIEYQRAQIRKRLGFREATVEDAEALSDWLCDHVLPQGQSLDHLYEAVWDHCRDLHIEPPTPERIDRLVRSARHAFEERFCAATLKRLSPQARERLEALLLPNPNSADGTQSDLEPGRAVLTELHADPGSASLASVLEGIAKLDRLRALGLPPGLFDTAAPKVLQAFRQRLVVEAPFEVRRHATPLRLTLLAVFGYNGGASQVWRYNGWLTNWTAVTGTNTTVSQFSTIGNGLFMVANNGGPNRTWQYSGSGTNWILA